MRLIDRATLIASMSAAALFVCTVWVGAQAPAAAPAQAPPATQGAPPPGRGGLPGTESGWATFQGQCVQCHSIQPLGKGPTAWDIRQMTPERIVAGLTKSSHTEGQA